MAAFQEFGTLGYENVNIEKICKVHGISKGMMYHYFSNKDDLFLACVQKVIEDLTSFVQKQCFTFYPRFYSASTDVF